MFLKIIFNFDFCKKFNKCAVLINFLRRFYIVQIKDENLKPRIKDPNNKQSVLKTVQNLFHTLLGFKSKCKLLTLYKVPEEMGGIIELCVLCIESKGFDLSKQAKKFFEKKWMQIEDGDKSTDFTIRSGEEICLEFRGNVKAIEGQSSVIKFLKNGSNFAHVKLRSLSNKDPNGYILMVRKDNLLDWKRLDSGYLVEKYEGKLILIHIIINRDMHVYSYQLHDYIFTLIYKFLKETIKSH